MIFQGIQPNSFLPPGRIQSNFLACVAIDAVRYATVTVKDFREVVVQIWDFTCMMVVPNSTNVLRFAGGYSQDTMRNVITYKKEYKKFSFEELRLKYFTENFESQL